MASFLSTLSVVPSFEPYTGPYRVGTVDVELPLSKLASFPKGPDPSINTLSFRMFYPCQAPSRSTKSAYWIPSPQSDYLSAYIGMSGLSPALASLIGVSARLLHFIKLPASADTELLSCPHRSARWPVMVFSHGLGGTRNAYSRICGLLASYGIVVMALEHRDGSAPLSVIRDGESKARLVRFRRIPHTASPEVDFQRNQQLHIRLWELGCAHEALIQLDQGTEMPVLLNGRSKAEKSASGALSSFHSSLDVHRPGAISWAGHSFGAASVFHFLKTVFYRDKVAAAPSNQPAYSPSPDAAINAQITPASTLCLLDPWLTPLQSSATRSLRHLPLPCYAPDGPGGSNVVAILSEAFFKWKAQLLLTKELLSANSRSFKQHRTADRGPFLFYPKGSAHVAQSDFGILFPWAIKRIFDNRDPDRILRLNMRAMLAVLRLNGKMVADTSLADMEIHSVPSADDRTNAQTTSSPDRSILQPHGSIDGWIALSTSEETQPAEASNEKTSVSATPEQAIADSEAA